MICIKHLVVNEVKSLKKRLKSSNEIFNKKLKTYITINLCFNVCDLKYTECNKIVKF